MVSIESRCIAPRRVPRWALAAAAAGLGLLAGASAASSPPREIIVVSDINYPPYLFQTDEGELQGILEDKWTLWSKRAGIPTQVRGMEWIKAQESVQAGSADVIEALSYTEARARLYEFSPAYAPIEARVFFHRSISGINDVASMRGFSIGAKEGSACAAWLMERGIDSVRGYPDSGLLVKAAGAGEVRLFCMDTPAAHYFLFKLGLADEFRETPPLYTTNFHWAVRKGRTELRDFIQSGFERITASELADVDARWLGTPLRFQLNERYVYYLSIFAAGVIGLAVLLAAWNRALRSKVSAKTAELSAALASLQKSERRLATIIKASPQPISITRLDDGTYVEANPACERQSGYAREEMIGKNSLELRFWPDPEERRRFVADLLRDGMVESREVRTRHKSGAVREVLTSAALIESDEGQFILAQSVDVTERRRAERLLQQSEERFQRIFSGSPYPMVMTRLGDLKIVEANQAALKLFAFSREEVVGKTTLELNVWERAEDQERFLKLLDERKELRDLELRLRDRSGNSVDMLTSAQVMELNGEEFIVTTLVDITARKRTERLLEESEARLAKIIEASPMSIAINSIEDGRFIEANLAFEQLWGYTRDELIGHTPLELGFWPVPEDRERFISELQRDGVVHGREFSLRRRDGELRDVLASIALIELKGKQFSLFQSLDITERKRAERLLEESERRLAKVIEASPEAITIASVEDGTFIQVNPAGERLCGYNREELIGRSAVDLGFWVDLDERRRMVADLQRGEEVRGREVRLRHKTGEVRDILCSAAMIDLKGRKFILFQAIDITGQKAAEKALRAQELVLRELSAHHDAVREGERAHVAREIHDELGQALTALKMELSVIGMKFGETAPQVREPVQALKARVDAIIQTVRNVATALRPAALDLGILPGVEWLVGEFRKRSGIHCTVSLTGNDIILPEDRSIVLFRILQESLTNISRHANARKVEILLDHDAERIRMDVQDDGVGFDVEGARGRKTFGLLGMQERAIMLRGEMSITSAPGRGTRVSVSMPFANP